MFVKFVMHICDATLLYNMLESLITCWMFFLTFWMEIFQLERFEKPSIMLYKTSPYSNVQMSLNGTYFCYCFDRAI